MEEEQDIKKELKKLHKKDLINLCVEYSNQIDELKLTLKERESDDFKVEYLRKRIKVVHDPYMKSVYIWRLNNLLL